MRGLLCPQRFDSCPATQEEMKTILFVAVMGAVACGSPNDREDAGRGGGSAAGGTAGGSRAGGSAAGGSAGGSTAGGSAAGGSAGGSTAGGSTAGGSAGGSTTGGGTASGRDAGIALDVRWGNQVKGSELLVFETGRYTVRERACCPPSFQSDGGTLSSTQTMGMLSDLTAARAGRLVVLDGGNAFGDTYGEAVGFDTDGSRVPLREHTPVLEQANDSAAAERLRTLINTLVGVDVE